MRLKINAKPPSRRCQALVGESSPDQAIVESVVQNTKTEDRCRLFRHGKTRSIRIEIGIKLKGNCG